MDLKQFVSKILQQIVGGVADAQASSEEGGKINPPIMMNQKNDAAKLKILRSDTGEGIHLVDFDVAVSVEESTETTGGVGLVVGPVVFGSRGQSNAENSSISRIKFAIPIAYPNNKS